MQTHDSEKQIKILYCITKSNWGGAQRYVFDLATGLSKEPPYAVAVALGGDGTLKQRLDEQHIPVIQITSLGRDVSIPNDIKVFFELLSILRRERPNVIHLNSSKIGILGALAGRLVGCRTIIFTAHGWAHTEDRPRYQKIIIKTLHWLTIMLSHKTIAVSKQTKNELSDTPFAAKKLVVIYNGITIPDFYAREEAEKRIFGNETPIQSSKIILGTIAELHKNKGLTYAIEAFSRVLKNSPHIHFIVIGSGEEKEALNTLVQKLHLQKDVTFYESNQANKYLKAFDIFILPSIKEGLPYTILEAGCAELPVIASNVGGIKEILPNEHFGILVESGNVPEIVKNIELLLKDPGKRRSLAKDLHEYIANNFSTKKMITETTALYTTQS